MTDFIIRSPHTKEECLAALDETLKEGPEVLAKFEWGCAKGDHTAYGIVKAENQTAALNYVPRLVRSKAIVQEVARVTPDDIRSYHRA